MSTMGSTQGFRRALLLTGSGDVVSLALLFLETMVVVRLLPADAYGTYVLLLITTNFLVMVIDLGCKVSVTQLISTGGPARQQAVVGSALMFRAAVVGVVTALILVFQGALTTVDPSFPLAEYVGYLPLMLAPASFDELLFAILQGFKAYRPMAIARIARSFLRIALTVVLLVVFQTGIAALVYSWCITFSVAAVYQFWAMPTRKVWSWQASTLADTVRFGFPLQMSRFLDFLATRLQVTLVGVLAGVDSVAFYAVATRIPDAIRTLSDSYSRVYFPTMTTLLATGQRESAEWTLARSLCLVSFVGALAALCATVFREEIMSIVFSSRYASSAPAFALLMLALHASMLLNIMGYTLTAAGRPGRSLVVDMVRTVVGIVGNLVLIPIVGFVGAACAVLTGSYVSGPVAAWLVRRSQLTLAVAPHVKQSLILLLCAMLGWWVPPDGPAAALAYRVAIVILFIVLSLSLSTISRDDLALVVGGRALRSEPADGPLPTIGPRGVYERR